MTIPFLKWPGGKRWLARELGFVLRPRLDGTYLEPFLGSGALFFALSPKRAILSDINAELINTFRQVARAPAKLARNLSAIPVSREQYEVFRGTATSDPFERALRFLYFNRTAFGGLYRVNRDGRFNVPYGGGERTPRALYDGRILRAASRALRGVTLRTADFAGQLATAGPGDVVYCDPTYTVAHNNNGFIRYNQRNFSWQDQQRLAVSAEDALARGAIVIISNAAHAGVVELYKSFSLFRVHRYSCLSPRPASRTPVVELLAVPPQLRRAFSSRLMNAGVLAANHR